MTDANAGLGGAFDSYSVQGKVFINLSLWVLRVCVCVCVCVCMCVRDGRGLKTSQQRTDYFNKDCAVLSRSVVSNSLQSHGL